MLTVARTQDDGKRAPPRLNGRYLVTRLLGKGAQARVYLGFDGRLRQWRAIKVLAAQFVDDEAVRARFLQEARAMAALSHPHILRVVDVDQDGRTPFMVMELARGGSISDWMSRHRAPLPPRLACDVARQCAEALGHAHAQGIVHRDVKPHNLLVRDDGTVVLTDFGIAQVGYADAMTQVGSVMGTFAFMAPEQRADTASVDHRADVYSLGATLFTLLTRRTSAELFYAEANDEILAGVPDVLQPVVLSACRYERDQRYRSTADLAEALVRRGARLPADPPDVVLTDALLALPESPPAWLDRDAEVDDLRSALALSDDDQATFVPSGRSLEEMLEDQPTTMYSDTSPPRDRPSGHPTPAGGLRPSSNAVPAPLLPPVTARARASLSELSEEDAPEITTMNLPSRRERGTVEITDGGARFVSADRAAPGAGGRNPAWLVASAAVGLLLSLLLLLGYGVATKAWASHARSVASGELVRVALEEGTVAADLAAAGADPHVLEERWGALQEADPADQAPKAAAFAEAVRASASTLAVDDLVKARVGRLRAAGEAWDDANDAWRAAHDGMFARATGDLGSW